MDFGSLYDAFQAMAKAGLSVPYVYFCLLNGKGERGTVSIITNSDASGAAGENAGIDIELKKVGAAPEPYTYEAAPGGGEEV